MQYESETMRNVKYGLEIVFKIDRYTTPITFEFAPERKTYQINVFESHNKVFTAMKMMHNTTKIIANKEKFFEYLDSFSEEQLYLEHLPSHNEV